MEDILSLPNVPTISAEPLDFKPLQDVMIVEVERDRVTKGGIALPDNAHQDLIKGRVIRCGPGRVTEFGVKIDMPVQEGDQVYLSFMTGAPNPVQICGKPYLLVRARDIAGVVGDARLAKSEAAELKLAA
jgi:chaperonin GroES